MSLQSTRALTVSLLTGLCHLTAAGLLWSWFGFTTRVVGNELFLAYNLVGAFLLGVLPAALLATKRLRSPAVVVGALFTLAAYGTWSTYVAPATPPTPVDPTPFGWYLLGWPAVTAAALLGGGAEYGLRRYRATSTEANGTTE